MTQDLEPNYPLFSTVYLLREKTRNLSVKTLRKRCKESVIGHPILGSRKVTHVELVFRNLTEEEDKSNKVQGTRTKNPSYEFYLMNVCLQKESETKITPFVSNSVIKTVNYSHAYTFSSVKFSSTWDLTDPSLSPKQLLIYILESV